MVRLQADFMSLYAKAINTYMLHVENSYYMDLHVHVYMYATLEQCAYLDVEQI